MLRVDYGEGPVPPSVSSYLRGARKVAGQALLFGRGAGPAVVARQALVNGAPGIVGVLDGRTKSVLGFTVRHGLIVEIDIQTDPRKLRHVDPALGDA